MNILVFAFWMLVFLYVYYVGWNQKPRPTGQDSGTLPFFIIALASAAAGFFVMYRALSGQNPLTPVAFKTKLLISLALLELTTLIGIFIVGPVRYEPMTQLLVGISAVGIPIVGFGGVAAFWRTQGA